MLIPFLNSSHAYTARSEMRMNNLAIGFLSSMLVGRGLLVLEVNDIKGFLCYDLGELVCNQWTLFAHDLIVFSSNCRNVSFFFSSDIKVVRLSSMFDQRMSVYIIVSQSAAAAAVGE